MKRLISLLCLAPALFAATFTPVNLSSLARASNVVTATTATAHGLSANQGFCIAGVTTDTSFDICGTIATVPTSTTFTFTQVAANASVGAGGTVQAAKRVIVLATIAAGPYLQVAYLLWNTTTQGLVNSSLTSSWTGTGDALFNEELNAIKAGTTVETARSISFPNTLTAAQIQQFMSADWSAQQNNLASGVQPGQFYGQFCDQTGCSF